MTNVFNANGKPKGGSTSTGLHNNRFALLLGDGNGSTDEMEINEETSRTLDNSVVKNMHTEQELFNRTFLIGGWQQQSIQQKADIFVDCVEDRIKPFNPTPIGNKIIAQIVLDTPFGDSHKPTYPPRGRVVHRKA